MSEKFAYEGYGQLELNNVAFRRDGRIEAQCALSTADFTDEAPAENGMLLAVDKANNVIKKPVDGTLPVALNYTTEHMYDERHPGLKNFKLAPSDGFYPRMGYLSVGDLFTTNCLCYDSSAYTDASALDSALISDKHCRCHTYSNHQAIAMNSKIANRKQIIIHAYSPN